MSTLLENSYQKELPNTFYTNQLPTPVVDPNIVCFNTELANKLGLSEKDFNANILSGTNILPKTTPLAQAYAGHQFGHFNKLGDGRAILLGEHKHKGVRYDVQLKGAGATPYSRRGDGRATLYSMLREYLISEAMHSLNISTTRSLAVVKTGEAVYREQKSEGGVLTRIAESHIRVGTFEYARYLANTEDLKSLTNYTIKRHYPDLENLENQELKLLEMVMDRQIKLIVDWMRVGFIHGVMNTDNMSIPGETIDYGPCAFMNSYSSNTVFSSIDREQRYAYGNQPRIAHWNLAMFANSLLPLIDEDEEQAVSKAKGILNTFPEKYDKIYTSMMFKKLGIANPKTEDIPLIQEILTLLTKYSIDYTNFFVALGNNDFKNSRLNKDENFHHWLENRNLAHHRYESSKEGSRLMVENNPIVIPRNHLVEKALNEASSGDFKAFNDLLLKLKTPYSQSNIIDEVPENFDSSYQTFCGT